MARFGQNPGELGMPIFWPNFERGVPICVTQKSEIIHKHIPYPPIMFSKQSSISSF